MSHHKVLPLITFPDYPHTLVTLPGGSHGGYVGGSTITHLSNCLVVVMVVMLVAVPAVDTAEEPVGMVTVEQMGD